VNAMSLGPYASFIVTSYLLAAGVVRYLHKPLEEAELIRCLLSVFGHGKPAVI